MPYSLDEKKRAITRVRRIKGQAEALERAIEDGTECSVLLQQISAMRGASTSLMAEVLDSHLRELFGSARESLTVPFDPDNEIDVVMKLLRTYLK